MADKNGTKKELARGIFFNEYNKTGRTLSGYKLAKLIECDIRALCRYSAEFKSEISGEIPKTPGHREEGLTPGETDDKCFQSCFERNRLVKEISELNREILRLKNEELTTQQVKQYLFNLSDVTPEIPKWVVNTDTKHSIVVPSLLLSDIHYAEVIDPNQVYGVNEYNMKIADHRLRVLATNLIDILKNHISYVNYPGLVLLLAGDFLSGNIHDELIATNDTPIMPAFVRLLGTLKWFVNTLADEFGNLMLFGTAGGNHSRMTKKVPSKNKAYTNFDWLLYRMMEMEFKDDKRVNFHISDGDDVQFRILNHKYRMTHGDQFRGGTGFIGPFAPITRNETKKRSAAETYGQNYDTLVIGHFHQRMMLGKVIVNSSVVGYNEYAINNNFPYEPPQQALWLTHAKRGITGSWPVFCADKTTPKNVADWVSWPK